MKGLMTIKLPGWTCNKCRAFNGEAKAKLHKCRCCDTPKARAMQSAKLWFASLNGFRKQGGSAR